MPNESEDRDSLRLDRMAGVVGVCADHSYRGRRAERPNGGRCRVSVTLLYVGYYVRALLERWEDLPLSDLIAFSREYGHELRPERPGETPVDDPAWRQADLLGPKSSAPIEVEVALDDGTADCLLRGELEEFREELEDSEGSRRARRMVAKHLDRTQAIVGVRVLASDSDNGLQDAWAVLAYYAQRSGVLFQADGEGFYKGEKLVVETG